MISTKDLRDIIDEATRKASDAIGDAKIPEVKIPEVRVGARRDTNDMLVFGMGLLLGTIVGMVLAFLMTPYSGEQARQKLNEQVDKVRRREEMHPNGGSTYGASTPGYGSSSGAYSRPPQD